VQKLTPHEDSQILSGSFTLYFRSEPLRRSQWLPALFRNVGMNTRKAKSIAGDCLIALGLYRRLRDRGLVAAFHRVSDLYHDSLTCSVRTFETFCQFFARRFTVIPLDEMVRRLERGQKLSGTVALTFDDGYRDNYEFAAPILRSLGLPATFFVVSDFMESNTVAHWDRELTPVPAWMTWSQVRQLHNDGFGIGAHTRTHVNLGHVVGVQAEQEISGSREEIEARIGAAVDLFAYPYGGAMHLTESNRQLVRKYGFRCCASCCGGTNPRGGDPFDLRRVPITTWFSTPSQLALEVAIGSA
jgi:peptidoglycan/xylan/chitin deacetylase (PgdA/CDA1 family)